MFAVVALQALGAPLPGTTALIAAAVYAATSHGLPIVGVIVAGALGALAGADAWVQVVLVCAGVAWLVVSLMVLRRRALRRIRAASALVDAK